jgi:DNA-binding PadR family transcriptional regulator
MHEHRRFDSTTTEGPRFGPGFPERGGREDRYDRFGDALRGRAGGRGKGRGNRGGFGPGFGPGFGGGFGAGFGPPMFGRGPKRGRGDVRAAIIALLAEEPMHGYQIITELTERSGGAWRPSPGSVYPTLQVLEDQGLVTADQSEGRRVFSLTDAGRAEAAAAGDGPAPWEDAARDADRSLVDLRSLMGEVGAAIMQVGRTGSEHQIRAVAAILTETRRRIYLVLADGTPAEDETDAGTSAGPDTAPGG